MRAFGNMSRTGRIYKAPASDLVEVVADSGLKHWVINGHPTYAGHAALSTELLPRLPFLRDPGVMGLSRIQWDDLDQGCFAYPTGTVYPLVALMDFASKEGGIGVRAALELLYVLGEVLVEGAEKSRAHGMGAHGALDPWRVALKPDGQALLLGYGIAKPDLAVFLEHPTNLPSEDTLRYCAPETLRGEAPTLSTDFYVLGLLALELGMGEPVYEGNSDEIRQQVLRGEGVRRLYEWRDRIPERVREVLGVVFRPDRASRFDQPYALIQSFHQLLTDPATKGAPLVDWVARLAALSSSGERPRAGEVHSPSRTGSDGVSSTCDEQAKTAGAAADSIPDEPTNREQRHEGEKMSDDSARDRLKSRLKGRSVGAAPKGENLSPRERLKQRLKGRSAQQGADPVDPEDDDTAVVQRPVQEAAQEVEESEPASDSVDQDEVTEEPSQEEEARVEPEEDAPDEPQEEPAAAPEPSPTAADLLARLKSSLSASSVGSEPSASARLQPGSGASSVTMNVRRGDQTEAFELREDQTVDDLLRAVLGSFPAVNLNLLGQVTSWARLEESGRRLNASTRLEDLDASQTVDVVWVEQAVRVVDLEVRGAASEPIRFQVPVGSALPAGAVLQHLMTWLSLPDGQWQLTVDGQVLAPDMLLEECGLKDGSHLVVSR
jgi:hypothetical protein